MEHSTDIDLNQRRLRALIQNMTDVITIHGADGTTLFESPSAARVLGYGTDGLIGRTPFEAIHPKDVEAVRNVFAHLLGGDLAAKPIEFRFRHAQGRWIVLEAIGANLMHDPGIRGIVLTSRDITHRKVAEARVVRAANYDALTGLPNRVLMRDRLAQGIAAAQRNGGILAVLFADLDRFKRINDSMGHLKGDNLLRMTAERLRTCMREMDTLSRFGGDEFNAVLPDMRDARGAAVVAQKILKACSEPFDLGGQTVHVSTSVGIAMYPADGTDPDTLLRNADLAMYAAKSQGRNAFRFFTPDLDAGAQENLRIEAGLRTSLTEGGFILEYQPKVDLATQRIRGVEALLRWRMPANGVLLPSHFIPVAEDTGLIIPIGQWVLDTACRAIGQWHKEGMELPVAINVSARQLRQQDLAAAIRDSLEAHEAPAHSLEVEITESAFVDDSETAARTLKALKKIGVRTSVDDFGTGYASLHYLKRFPFDILKIDRCFVDGIERDSSNAAIVEAIVNLSGQLGIGVVAEGIETPEQLAALCDRGCNLGQGFYFSPSVPPEKLTGMLAGSFEAGSWAV